MPIIAIEPGWGAIFCCDGAGTGGLCDPWCDNASPEAQERWITSQHTGAVDFGGFPYRCDGDECWCNRTDDDD